MSAFGGKLVITVVQCESLAQTQWFGEQYPYVVVEYGKKRFRTVTCRVGGNGPKFNEKIDFNLIEKNNKARVEVWKKNTLPGNTCIGVGEIQLDNVLKNGYEEDNFSIRDNKGRKTGEVKLIMKITNNIKEEYIDCNGPCCVRWPNPTLVASYYPGMEGHTPYLPPHPPPPPTTTTTTTITETNRVRYPRLHPMEYHYGERPISPTDQACCHDREHLVSPTEAFHHGGYPLVQFVPRVCEPTAPPMELNQGGYNNGEYYGGHQPMPASPPCQPMLAPRPNNRFYRGYNPAVVGVAPPHPPPPSPPPMEYYHADYYRVGEYPRQDPPPLVPTPPITGHHPYPYPYPPQPQPYPPQPQPQSIFQGIQPRDQAYFPYGGQYGFAHD